MLQHRNDQTRIGYILKMYPRFSETFIVTEILAHERAGVCIDIISLRAPVDGRFHETLADVAGSVSYVDPSSVKGEDLWRALHEAAADAPRVWETANDACDEDARDVYQAALVAQHVRRRGICHLHAHFASVATTVARLAAQMCDITYSFTAHAKDIYHESVEPQRLARAVRDASHVITVSDYNLDYLGEIVPGSAGKVHRVYNGLDLREFRFNEPRSRQPLIVAVGRLVEKKGFEYLVDACAHLRDSGRPVACRIIGTGPLEQALRDRVEVQGLGGLVTMPGALTHAQIIREVSQARVLAAPCIVGADGNRDGLPTVLLEAMALGTPCVSTDVTGIPEVLRDGRTGLLAPQRDSCALADAIQRLLHEENLAVSLAREARALIEREFDIDVNTVQMRALHERAITARRPALIPGA